ncbi:D-aminoacyl-tRNA deacylase [Clostridium septicum]|uniref:D-aminoacyl-tRNA deacylase n=1 Tax=Clostridium septicum TaxID=1504 RepID=A0A9N7JN35_CLOSE|nr:D-aminoacyl-tRNA deacylase [Clostridium septicum]AYE35493.1 D-tyrosyl-tRNA(Tyr) deacylase [Clostridium septicum]MDU1314663.1 D-aminoacyl-tRNA deacylase [Clostridium septicum]QAS60879.1 D-tyrosyl-tRNA(Tyr) deacylase [Clostridium septicum]UEC19851.1 D-tyrosyl-tRNA(Tyr) deacylase [Clostridium septicum]USS02089.1 D-aminoacyl-tRNA deacylase [Clostridium septicum]
MRAVVQRVSSSKVVVDDSVIGSIGRGVNVLIGISKEDTEEDLIYIRDKVINLRIFEDENSKMNLSLLDIKGEILAISQFTLYGDCRKGRRPNFMNAEGGERAKELYNRFIELLKESKLKVETGEFGADMKVDIQNDGPVTLLLESKRNF